MAFITERIVVTGAKVSLAVCHTNIESMTA
jgi:hypothetical protein